MSDIKGLSVSRNDFSNLVARFDRTPLPDEVDGDNPRIKSGDSQDDIPDTLVAPAILMKQQTSTDSDFQESFFRIFGARRGRTLARSLFRQPRLAQGIENDRYGVRSRGAFDG